MLAVWASGSRVLLHHVYLWLQIKDRDDHDLDERRFMVAVWGSGGKGPSTTLVMVDHEGNMVDMLYCGQLSGSIRQSRAVQENDMTYEEAIRDPHKASAVLHGLPCCLLGFELWCPRAHPVGCYSLCHPTGQAVGLVYRLPCLPWPCYLTGSASGRPFGPEGSCDCFMLCTKWLALCAAWFAKKLQQP